MFKRTILFAKGGIFLSIFFSKSKEIMHYGFAVLEGWSNASALFKDILTDLKASSTFPKESLSDMFRFVQSTFPGEDALHEKDSRTL